jgi:hypothetical protein
MVMFVDRHLRHLKNVLCGVLKVSSMPAAAAAATSRARTETEETRINECLKVKFTTEVLMIGKKGEILLKGRI